MPALWRVLFTAPVILTLTSCIDFADMGPSDRYKEDFHYSYPLSTGGTVTLENANGSVEISGWEQDKVEINGTKYASTKDLLDAVKIETSASSGAVRIRTSRPLDWHGNGGARYSIRVPRKALLDSIVTTNGSIRVDDLDGNARLRSTNGTIRAGKIHGELEAHTTNGNVEAMDVDGNSKLRTSNGNIKADASHGTLEAETTNGSIRVALADPSAGWPVRLHSTNGSIEARIRGGKLPDVRAETTNSSLTLYIPRDASARVRAHTSHSSISSDFDLSGGSERSKTSLEGSIGSGGPILDLSSTNGSIKILKM